MDDKMVKKILDMDAESRRAARIKVMIDSRDKNVVVEKKPEPKIEWMVGTND